MISRRRFSISSACAAIFASSSLRADAIPLAPSPQTLNSGDLLWPKKPGVYVPYDTNASRDAERDRETWQREKEAFLSRVDLKAPYLREEDRERLRELTFDDFYKAYAGARPSGQFVEYGAAAPIYVGHVAMVQTDDTNDPWIIEALWGSGVVRSRYSAWLSARPGERIWQGRLRSLPEGDRRKVSVEALKSIGRPYDFWNFDLNDDASFYCSKLVWLATYRALGFAIDDNPNPKRSFWFSPKQLLYTPRIQIILDQGPYARG
jgi:hypothetical protein